MTKTERAVVREDAEILAFKKWMWNAMTVDWRDSKVCFSAKDMQKCWVESARHAAKGRKK